MSQQVHVRYTGHPLLDVGVAALCAMAFKTTPADLTISDLDAAANELENAYGLPSLLKEPRQTPWINSYLSCVYPNGAFTNPTMGNDGRIAEANRALRSHNAPVDRSLAGKQCVFSGEPATTMADRCHVPLFQAAVCSTSPRPRREVYP
ncbi:MAG: hypothetical protein IPK82_07040 [Polyangiaceae bacterium]|nr:hypothetical protein [Polyangiaceae bacterium]